MTRVSRSLFPLLPMLLLAGLFLSACGGGSGEGGAGSPPVATPLSISGTFVDSPVDGLHYTSLPSNPAGSVTQNGGHYQCQPGDSMTFDLGGRVIGNPQPCGPIVTALSVFGATSMTDQRVVNLSQLLLTLGGIPTGQNPIQLPATVPAGLRNPLNFSDQNFDQNSLSGTTLVSEAEATTHLQASFKTLSVTVVNSSTVMSNPDGINCTAGTCTSVFVTGTTITLTATGTGFTGWSGAGCSGTDRCVVTLNADAAVTATSQVAPPPATLTILPPQGTGTGSVTCSMNGGVFGACAASYTSGTILVLRGTADSGSSTFTGWIDGTGNATVCNLTTADCSMNLNADSAVRPTFVLNATTQFSVTGTPATANGGGGVVSCSVPGGTAAPCGSYPVGTAITVTAAPNSASNFTGWTSGIGNAAVCNGTTGACTFTLTTDSSVTANFNRPILSVVLVGTGTVTSNPTGIDCGASGATCTAAFNKGTSITLTASAQFSGWSGASCSGTGTCVVTLNQSTTITATFNDAGLPPFAQQAYLKASNTNANDIFGFSVALYGDTLAVGARGEASNARGVINTDQADNSAPNSGAVYVFTRTAGVWTQQAYLKASNTDAGDEFGSSIVLEGDTLAVGAQGEASNATGVNGNESDNSAPNSGAVYVFTRTAGVWTQQAYLKASNTDAGDRFGISLALADDTVAVGARIEASAARGVVNADQADNSALDSGAVYVFTRTNGVWSQQAYLKASNTDAGDEFGTGVALSGDTLAVSAQGEASNARGVVNADQADNSAPNSGAVYVFTRTAGVWTQQAYLKASNTDAGDMFGDELALSGDTVVVGARFEASAASGVNANQADNSAPNSGAAYVFTRTAGVWTQQAYLKASNAGANQNFGGSVAIAGDIVAVGARLEDSNATGINGDQGNTNAPDSGAVYVFMRSGGMWTQQAYLKASNTNAGDQFGESVALSGNTNTLVVTAPLEASSATGVNGTQSDNSASSSGAAYVFQW